MNSDDSSAPRLPRSRDQIVDMINSAQATPTCEHLAHVISLRRAVALRIRRREAAGARTGDLRSLLLMVSALDLLAAAHRRDCPECADE